MNTTIIVAVFTHTHIHVNTYTFILSKFIVEISLAAHKGLIINECICLNKKLHKKEVTEKIYFSVGEISL